MEALPAELTIDILSRLPVNSIIRCQPVCKKWRNLVSESSFVNLHLSRSPTGLIIQRICMTDPPGILITVEIEDKLDYHRFRNQRILDLNIIPVLRNSIEIKISLKGSVNGLIYLWQTCFDTHDNTCICNPVTREIIVIPDPPQRHVEIIACGFGVSSLTGEYKVVRTLNREIPLSGNKSESKEDKVYALEAEVYTLGTGQWRSLGPVSYRLDGSNAGAVVNDHCHWIVSDYEDAPPGTICAFDLNKETFQLFPSPPSEEAIEEESDFHFQSLAVLKGCLCKSDGSRSHLTIWMMKEYGIEKSWHKHVVITEEALNRGRKWPYWYTLSLITDLKDGTILFGSGGLWAFNPTTDTVEGIDAAAFSEMRLTFRPSFLKLQNFESERVHMF